MACDVAGEWRQIVDTRVFLEEGIHERRFPKVVCALLSTRYREHRSEKGHVGRQFSDKRAI